MPLNQAVLQAMASLGVGQIPLAHQPLLPPSAPPGEVGPPNLINLDCAPP